MLRKLDAILPSSALSSQKSKFLKKLRYETDIYQTVNLFLSSRCSDRFAVTITGKNLNRSLFLSPTLNSDVPRSARR